MITSKKILTFALTVAQASVSCWLTATVEVSLRHCEGRGIGYSQGYTSVGLFASPVNCMCREFYPFLDLRGHGFNNRKIAANAGIGVRYYSESLCEIFGTNIYYDYRQGYHKGFDQIGGAFRQIGFGLEALGPCWDIRANFYLPISKKTRKFKQLFLNDASPPIPFEVIKFQTMLRGADAELGTSLGQGLLCSRCVSWSAYLAAGPYYLEAKKCSALWGGKFRLSATINHYFSLEIRGSYDHVYDATLQACIGINIPFFPDPATKELCRTPLQGPHLWPNLKALFLQPVQRAEILSLRSFR